MSSSNMQISTPPSPHHHNLLHTSSNANLNPHNNNKPTRHQLIMDKLKASVLQKHNKSPTLIASLERLLLQSFPSFRTPAHLPYASMIRRAIEDLKEEGGSAEGSISEYIVAKYEDLPWAHKSYLRHYLDKLRESGEIVCISTECYTLPGLTCGPEPKKKLPRLQLKRKRKDGVSEEGVWCLKEVTGVTETEVGFQEEEIQVFGKSQVKRRRRSLVVYEDEEEVEGAEAVGREKIVEKSTILVSEGPNEVSEIIGKDEIDEKNNSTMEQRQVGTVGEHHESMIIGEGSPKAQLVESNAEMLLPEECQAEVRTEVLASNQDLDVERNELQLPLVQSTVDSQSEARAETVKLGCESINTNLMLVPIEDVNKLERASSDGNPVQASVSNIDGDASNGTVQKSLLKEHNHHSFRDADLMIVPFEVDRPKPSPRREIICGLSCDVMDQPKRKQQVYHPRRKVKRCQEEATGVLEVTAIFEHETEPNSVMLNFSKSKGWPCQSLAHTSSHGAAAIVRVEVASSKASALANSQQKLMPIEDEDLNTPLQQVLENCKQKKLSTKTMMTSTSPSSSLAPSVLGEKLQVELADSENLAKKPSQNREERQHKPMVQLPPLEQKCQNVEPDTFAATESEVMSSSHLQKLSNENQETQIVDYVVHATPENFSAVTLSLDEQPNELGKDQQKRGDHGLWTKPEQTTEINLRESSPTANQSGEKDDEKQWNQSEVVEVGYGNSQPLTTAMEEKMLTDNDQLQSARCSNTESWEGNVATPIQNSQQETEQQKCLCQGRPPEAKEATEESVMGLQNQHLHQQEGPSELVIEESVSIICQSDEKKSHGKKPHLSTSVEGKVPISDQQCQQENKEPKVKRRGRPRKNKGEEGDAAASLNSQSKRKKGGQGRPRIQKDVTTDNVATPLDMPNQQQNGPSESATQQAVKTERRGRKRKNLKATKEDGATLQQEGPSEPTTQQVNKTHGRKRPREKLKSTINNGVTLRQERSSEPAKRRGSPRKGGASKEEAAVQEGSSEQATQQHSQKQYKKVKTEKRGRLRKKNISAEEDVAVSLDLENQLLQGRSEPATDKGSHMQNKSKKDGPRKQNEATKEDVETPLNLDTKQQEGPSEPATHLLQQDEQPKREIQGRHRSLKTATPEKEADQLKLHHQPLEQPSEQETTAVQDASSAVPLTKISANSGQPGSLRDLSNQDNNKQKQHKGVGSYKPEAATMLSVRTHEEELESKLRPQQKKLHLADEQPGKSQVEGQGTMFSDNETPKQTEQKELRQGRLENPKMVMTPLNQPDEQSQYLEDNIQNPSRGRREALKEMSARNEQVEAGKPEAAIILSDDGTHEQEKELNLCQVEKQLHLPDEQPGRPQGEAKGTMFSDDETPQQAEQNEPGLRLRNSKVVMRPLANQPDQQLEELSQQHEDNRQEQSTSEGAALKQKSAKNKAATVPLSSIDCLRSRVKQQSQDGT